MTTYTPEEVEIVWQQARSLLQNKLSPAVFSTWVLTNPLTNLEPQSEETVGATFTTPSVFHAINLKKNLNSLLQDSIEAVIHRQVTIEYVVGIAPTQRGWQVPLGGSVVDQTHHRVVDNSQHDNIALDSPTPQTPLKQQGGLSTPITSPSVESLFSESTMSSAKESLLISKVHRSGLNPQLTFASYAVSSSNEMAHAAAIAVSQHPGSSYNPLFLYGDVGVGKTHLMHAIGNNVLINNPDAAVLYCTGEDFTNEIVRAIQTKQASAFKHRYRTINLLMIDDVQFIAGKQTVQEEFFHTFNALTQQHSQVVLTSDRPPEEISLLESRLKSRFEAGLMVDIGQPTFELRTAILLLKAKAASIPLGLDQAKVVATTIESPRRLEGFISRIRSEIELKHTEFSDELIKLVLQKESRQGQKRLLVPPQEVIKTVSTYYQFRPLALRGMSREKHLVRARHVAMYLLKEEVCLSLVEIGRWFSNRDHTSVIHAVRRIASDLVTDQMIQKDVLVIKSRLQKKV